MKLDVGGRAEEVEIDPDDGPVVLLINGTFGFMEDLLTVKKKVPTAVRIPRKKWVEMSSSEQETLARLAAKKNQSLRALKGEDFWPVRARRDGDDAVVMSAAQREAFDQEARKATAARCKSECATPSIAWQWITIDAVTENYDKTAKGIIYGLDFPWTEAKLVEFGPEWLTKAFWKAGTLGADNRVVKIIPEKKIKITAGNNAGKFLFEVKYQKPGASLHTRLFGKVPFMMTPATKTDRLSSSVYKQPMDLYEIQTYRLFEASLPMKTPKFYYGDISNDTSNFILITERIPYSEIRGFKKKTETLEAYAIEGPYDKCKDFQLRGPVREYYLLLMVMLGRIAGYHKAGKMGEESFVRANLGKTPGDRDSPMMFGMNPFGCSGENPASYTKKLETAIKFFAETAKVVFPAFAATGPFRQKYTDIMLQWNAYANEIEYFKCCDPDHIALGHNNLNIDNAYFWRDDGGTLDCGLIDWGGFGASNLGHKIYWILNCSDFENIEANLSDYIDAFVTSYKESGGPQLDPGLVRTHLSLTAVANLSQMCGAIPNCFKMCPQKEWDTIKNRHDPRIADNIDGKSTLRSTLTQINNGLNMIQVMGADKELDRFVRDIWVGQFNQPAKSEEMIHGK